MPDVAAPPRAPEAGKRGGCEQGHPSATASRGRHCQEEGWPHGKAVSTVSHGSDSTVPRGCQAGTEAQRKTLAQHPRGTEKEPREGWQGGGQDGIPALPWPGVALRRGPWVWPSGVALMCDRQAWPSGVALAVSVSSGDSGNLVSVSEGSNNTV